MSFRILRLTASFAALLLVAGCGGSISTTSPSPSPAARSSPTVDPTVQEYRALVLTVDTILHYPAFLRYCQPIKPSTSSLCRDAMVRLVEKDNEALGMLDGAAVPSQFKTLHAALRAGVVEDLAINKRAISAIDSGIDTQAVLDASLKNYFDKIAPVVAQIQSG